MKKTLSYFTSAMLVTFFAVNIQAADTVNINVTGKVIASPCTTINGGSSVLNVDLGTAIQANTLVTAGSGSTMKAFDLPLTNCPIGTSNIKATFTGTADSTSPTRWKNTATTPAANTAVELSQQTTGTILSNNSTLIAPATAGSATFKLQARAYSAAGSVTPGDIASVVVATFEYQ